MLNIKQKNSTQNQRLHGNEFRHRAAHHCEIRFRASAKHRGSSAIIGNSARTARSKYDKDINEAKQLKGSDNDLDEVNLVNLGDEVNDANKVNGY